MEGGGRTTGESCDEPRVGAVFLQAAQKLFKSMMKRAGDGALELLNIGDLADCIQESRPNWIQLAIWERLIRDHWATNEFNKLFEKNRKNRLTKKEGNLTHHGGGSVSTKIHEKRLVCTTLHFFNYSLIKSHNLFKFLTNAGERYVRAHALVGFV